MSIHFYHDDCGAVGPPRIEAPDTDAADDARRAALCVADHVATLLDRWEGESGDDPAPWRGIAARLRAIEADVQNIIAEVTP